VEIAGVGKDYPEAVRYTCLFSIMALQTQEAEALKTRSSFRVPILIVVAVVVVIGLISTMRHGALLIRASKVQRQTISATISTNGKLEPVAGFEAHAPAATSVKKLFVKEGQNVKAGQLLLQLDDAPAKAEAARALAQVRAAQADLNAIKSGGTREEVITNRTELSRAQSELQAAQRNAEAVRKLQQTGAASPAEVQDADARLKNAQNQVNLLEQKTTNRFSTPDQERAQAALEQAQAAYSAAQDMLAKSNVRSTESGTVYSLPVKQGAFVNPGDLLVQVADLSRLIVRAFVDEPDIGRLAQGQKVAITWDALPGRTWDGTVTQVPSTVTLRGSRNVGEVTSEVANEDRKLLPNTNVSVVITTARHDNVLSVAREAVHQDDGKRFVYQVVDGHLQRKNVETSLSNLTFIEVTSGLPEGATVALGSVNGMALQDGMAVKTE
jgi:HlyD family secretion protein